mgnify:CR=1 FL=1
MTNRLLIGQRSTNEFGMWVSKPGYDVLTADNTQLLFGTNLAAIQILAKGTFTMLNGNTQTDVTIANYGFYPVPMVVYATLGTSYIPTFEYQSYTTVRIFHANLGSNVTHGYFLISLGVT